MNQLTTEKRAQVIAALVEGNSIRATVRLTGAAKNTVAKLLVEMGSACAEYLDKAVRNVKCQRVQADEIWSFCYAKENHLPPDKRGKFGYGDVWTYTAIDADTKLAVTWLVGQKSAESAYAFMYDLASRISGRAQLTTDSYQAYIKAIEGAFGDNVDYAMLSKLYGKPDKFEVPFPERRYSPPRVLSSRKYPIRGNPDLAHVSTSFVERQNLTMRMSMRRFTRLTNGFSKKVENLMCAVALWFMYYNFGRVHQTLGTTPAVAAGLADHKWEISEIIGLLDSSKSN